MAGEIIDFASGDPTKRPQPAPGRPFLGIQFECCDVYTRVYVNQEQTAYLGNCPKCGRRVRFQIGPGGTSSRFFRAS